MSMVDKIKKLIEERLISKEKHPHIPRHLDGQILIDEVVVDGVVQGWITITIDDLVKILEMRDNPSKRPDIFHVVAKKNFRDLTPSEFEEVTGWKRYFDKLRKLGLME